MFASSSVLLFGSHPGRLQAETQLNALCRFAEPPLLPVAPNLVARNFTVTAPNKVLTGDITYIWTEEGWLYLAVVIGLFNRQVVGFAMGQRVTRTLVMASLRMAWFRRDPAPGLIFHSDRGSQYASNDYRKLIAAFKMISSMSGKGD